MKVLKVCREQEIAGPELTTQLSFQCDVEIIEWRVQDHENLDSEIQRVTKEEQLYYILSMTFLSTEKAEEKGKGYSKHCEEDAKERIWQKITQSQHQEEEE